jgi:hypothetical protein
MSHLFFVSRWTIYGCVRGLVSSGGYLDVEVGRSSVVWRIRMGLYLVERKQPGLSIDQLYAAQSAAIEMSRRFTAEGKPARYIRTTLVSGEGRCLTLFEASSAKLVQELHEAAQITFDRIIEALELTA